MLAYVLDACRAIGIGKIYVVVGFGAELVKQRFADATDVIWVLQSEQKGTAHAVLCCKEQLKDFAGKTFVLCGDGPLIRPQTLQKLLRNNNGQCCGIACDGNPRRPDRLWQDNQGAERQP